MKIQIPNPLALYFGQSRSASDKIVKAERAVAFTTHVLFTVGMVTSLPAVGTTVYALLSSITDSVFILYPSIFLACGLYAAMVDLPLVPLATFAASESLRISSRSSMEKWRFGLSIVTIGTLAIVSMRFSYVGNAAIVDTLFADHSNKHQREMLALDSTKTAQISAISAKYDSDIAKAKESDAKALQEAKSKGAEKIHAAAQYIETKARAHKWEFHKYKGKLNEAIAAAKIDSATIVQAVQTTAQQKIAEMQRNIAQKESTFEIAKAATQEAEQKWKESIETKSAAVFMLTGGIGTASTLIALFFTFLSALMSYKPTPALSGRSVKDLKDDFHTYHATLKRALASGGDPSNSISKLSALLAEIEEKEPSFAIEKRQMLYNDYGVTC